MLPICNFLSTICKNKNKWMSKYWSMGRYTSRVKLYIKEDSIKEKNFFYGSIGTWFFQAIPTFLSCIDVCVLD